MFRLLMAGHPNVVRWITEAANPQNLFFGVSSHLQCALLFSLQNFLNVGNLVGQAEDEILVSSAVNKVHNQRPDGHVLCPKLLAHKDHWGCITKGEIVVLHRLLEDFLQSAGTSGCVDNASL